MSEAHPKRRWKVLPKEEVDGIELTEQKYKGQLGQLVSGGREVLEKKKLQRVSAKKKKQGQEIAIEQSRFPVLAFAFQKFLEKNQGKA